MGHFWRKSECPSIFQMTVGKNQYQSYYTDQSKQEETARWTNQNSEQLPGTCSRRGKNLAHKVRLGLALLLIGWKTGATFLSHALDVTVVIEYLLLSTVIWKLFVCTRSSNRSSSWYNAFDDVGDHPYGLLSSQEISTYLGQAFLLKKGLRRGNYRLSSHNHKDCK